MAALAVGHEQPARSGAQVLDAQAQHLTTAQGAQHHGLDHGPVPPPPQGGDEGVDLGRGQDLGQGPGRADQGNAPPTRAAGGQAPGDGVGRRLLAHRQVDVQPRHRRQAALDGAR